MFLIQGLGLAWRGGWVSQTSEMGLSAVPFHTSNDQVLQWGPSIGEVPLLACVTKRGWDPILVGQDLAVLEGSRHRCERERWLK